MQSPIVSVIIPCYNQAHYLDEAINSVFNQSFTQWECIVVNDGSEDETKDVAQKWIEKDSRFKMITIENGGLANARNTGIQESQGTYILPLDADDKINTEYLQLAVNAFNQNAKLKVVYCYAEKFGKQHGKWDLKDYSLSKLAVSNMIFCTALFRKTDWEKVGGYDTKMKYGWEDWEFWIALLKDGGEVEKLDYVGFWYRVNNSSMLQNMEDAQKEELFNYMSIKHADFFVNQVGSFQDLLKKQDQLKRSKDSLLSSKKNAINVLFYKIFRWKPFKLTIDKETR